MAALLILRFLGGAVGSNSLISAGAVVADLFPPRQRGLALAYYAVTPYVSGRYIPRRDSRLTDIVCSFLGPVYVLALPDYNSAELLLTNSQAWSNHWRVYCNGRWLALDRRRHGDLYWHSFDRVRVNGP